MKSISFRKATRDDLVCILDIEEESFADGIKESESIFLERLTTFSSGFILLEVKDYSKPVGYICSELWTYQQTVNINQLTLGHSIKNVHQPRGNELYISSMGVLPAYRGHGFGNLLLRELIDTTREQQPQVCSVLLIVAECWQGARTIYRRLGFRDNLILPGFFKQPGKESVNGIVMRKPI